MKNIVLTGASGGVGVSVVKHLLNENYFIFGLDLKDPQIESESFVFINCDISKKDEIEKAIEKIKEKTNHLDAIINIAGLFLMESLVEGSDEDLKHIIDVNFFGTYYLNKLAFPLLDSTSTIINMSSELARFSPQPFMAYYTLTKHMVSLYSDCLRRECAYIGTKVVTIEAGSLNTGMISKALNEYNSIISKTFYFKSPLTKLKRMMDKELKHTNDPSIIAKIILKALSKKKPKAVYRIKNSFSLKLLNIMPRSMQDYIYRRVIK